MALPEALALEQSWIPQRVWLGWTPSQASFTKGELAHALRDKLVEPTRLIDRHYRLTTRGKEAALMTQKRESPSGPPGSELFTAIEGYEDIKKALRRIAGGKLINVLLEGPPATSKSLFLLDLQRVPNTHLLAGSRVTAAGLADAILTYRPRLLLLDEIEKMQLKATSVLLSVMETGLITVTKFGQHTKEHIDLAVVAACNSSAKLPAEMLSRFGFHLRLKPYTGEQFMQVCTNFLLKQEKVALPVALRIAANTWSYLDKDVRTARAIARMLEPGHDDMDKQVDEWTQFLIRYGTAQ